MENRLTFTLVPTTSFDIISIHNKDKELLGRLEKIRIGKWMSWCLFLDDGCYLSAGCQDEVREKTKELNAKITQKTGDSKDE